MVYNRNAYLRYKAKHGDIIRERCRNFNRKRLKDPLYIEYNRKKSRDYYNIKKNNPNFLKNERLRINNIRKNQRLEVIYYYSNGLMNCNCCGENLLLFLEIDHLKNNGNKHRKTLPNDRVESDIIRNNFPEEYQILCCNCNKGKYLNGGMCPHNTNTYMTENVVDIS